MDEGEALLDLVLLDLIAVVAVVGLYLLQAKVRSFFKGFKGLQTEYYLRSTLGMPLLANCVRGRSGRPVGSRASNPSLIFWLKYWSRKGFAKALHRFTLERRLYKALKTRPKSELDDVAFSLMFWRRRDCPNEALYIARPPHHMTLHEEELESDERAAEERRQRILALKAKSDKQVMSWIQHDIRRRSSSSVQWLYDSLDRGWVGEIGTTKSKAIRLTEENQVGSS
jgi:hypothetical protein